MAAKLQPYIVEIKHGTQKHTKLLEYLMKRVQAARDAKSHRLEKWRDAEDLFQAYIPETETDARRRSLRDAGKPQYTTVTIPYSYATLMTAHTYWTSVFLARDPVLQVMGNSGESQMAEMAVESMLQHFIIAGRNLVPLFIWLLDQGKYGEGILGMTWDVERAFIPEAVTAPRTIAGIPIPNTSHKTWRSKEVIGYEGLKLFNVRPHDFLFDPTVTLQNFQSGEFAGHDGFVPMIRIQDGEALGKFFNVEHVEAVRVSARDQNIGRNGAARPQHGNSASSSDPSGVDLTELTIEIVPRDFSLAPREYVEKWTFTIANDSVIISAQPQGWYHNEFMYDTLEHEIEGYNTSKRGMLEMLQGLNTTLDWLINTHFFNVRKTLNNEFIYDPSILVSKDVEAPGPGKLIRVRPEAYGKDVRAAFYQLQQYDTTRGHMQDTAMIVEMMQRLTGVNDTVMGMMGRNRKTATEVRSSSSFSINRLKTQCEYYGAMGFTPMTGRAIKVSQQMYSGRQQRFFRMVGNQAMNAERFINVGPEEIAGSFDFLPVDGTLPIDRSAQAAVFGQLMQQMGQIPQVAAGYDFARLFGHVATLSGIRNLQQFRINVVPNAQAQAQAQAGNIVPVSGIPGGMATPNNQGIQEPLQ